MTAKILNESNSLYMRSGRFPFKIVGQCSTIKTSSALIYTGKCLLLGIKGLTDGTNSLTLTIYDNTSASGTVWDKIKIPGDALLGGIIYPAPMAMATGIYVGSSGGTHEFYVYYSELT